MLLSRLRETVSSAQVLTALEDTAPYLTDWRGRFTGRAQAVVLPLDSNEVAAIVSMCAETRTPIVPQGGNTGLVGGATPDSSGDAIVLSLKRLKSVREIDSINGTLTAEAGCVLHDVQQAAYRAGRLFPLSLAADGSARELALGLEVVLPSGEIWSGLRGLRKDNTGYDLRDLFIGAEGTLGVITAACLKTFPLPRSQVTALFALDSVAAALSLLPLAQSTAGPTLTAFEFFSARCLQLVTRHFPQQRSPFEREHRQYVLLELSDHEDERHAAALLQSLAEQALEKGLIADAAIAQSTTQGRSLWILRESISEAQQREGKNIKHDISVPISSISRFIDETDALLAQRFPGVRMVTFGHLGDGNLHYNVMPPAGTDEDRFMEQQSAIYECVHDQVVRFSGSISAEHGIGQLKREENMRYKSSVEMNLMRAIKRALDPFDIMNPGKVV